MAAKSGYISDVILVTNVWIDGRGQSKCIGRISLHDRCEKHSAWYALEEDYFDNTRIGVILHELESY